MNAHNRILGITMDTRRKRRLLVVASYTALALVTVVATMLTTGRSAYLSMYALYAVLAVNYFALGGYATPRSPGLVKSFANKPPQDQSVQSQLIRVNLESRTHIRLSDPAQDGAWKNDERELGRRDRAHYLAYQPLSVAIMVIVGLAFIILKHPHWIPPALMSVLLFAFAMAATSMALTLPQAIILWTEPDLPAEVTDQEAVAARSSLVKA